MNQITQETGAVPLQPLIVVEVARLERAYAELLHRLEQEYAKPIGIRNQWLCNLCMSKIREGEARRDVLLKELYPWNLR